MGSLLQLSGVIIDLIYRVERVPAAGTEATVTDFMLSAGGGFNAMVAARRAGLTVRYAGSLGQGPFAALALAALQTADIQRVQNTVETIDQGCCTVLLDADGERTFIAREGAESLLPTRRLNGLPQAGDNWALLSGYALHYAGSRDVLAQWLPDAKRHCTLVFDPGPLVSSIDARLLQIALARADWISANAVEASVLSGSDVPAEAARRLARDREGAVVRSGADGCHVAIRNGSAVHVPAYPVTVRDSNGAGDTHIGTFIAALDDGLDAVQAARQANAAAALSVTEFGPATAPDRQRTLAMLARHRKSD